LENHWSRDDISICPYKDRERRRMVRENHPSPVLKSIESLAIHKYQIFGVMQCLEDKGIIRRGRARERQSAAQCSLLHFWYALL
jgi:hypothetical protein